MRNFLIALCLVTPLCLLSLVAVASSASADACGSFPNDGGPAIGPNGECVNPDDVPDGSVDDSAVDGSVEMGDSGCSVSHGSSKGGWVMLLGVSLFALRRKITLA